jgi:hypothetical protein
LISCFFCQARTSATVSTATYLGPHAGGMQSQDGSVGYSLFKAAGL